MRTICGGSDCAALSTFRPQPAAIAQRRITGRQAGLCRRRRTRSRVRKGSDLRGGVIGVPAFPAIWVRPGDYLALGAFMRNCEMKTVVASATYNLGLP